MEQELLTLAEKAKTALELDAYSIEVSPRVILYLLAELETAREDIEKYKDKIQNLTYFSD